MYITQLTEAIARTPANCKNPQTIAQSELNSYLESQAQLIAPERRTVCTPQRRADYRDKARLRLKDLKRIAYQEYRCVGTAEIKRYLKILSIKIDLRLTAAWDAVVYELRHEIFAAKAILEAVSPQFVKDDAQIMIAAMREAIILSNWNPVSIALKSHREHKSEAWKQLTATEKQQLTALVPESVRLLAQAQKQGAIARFEEDSDGDLYWIWRSNDAKPELVTSSFVATFLKNLGASSP